ncbi:MAG: hypothetical protein ACOX7X_01445 [Methanosarcina flavescens]|uniref:hypothetical protein n=1 Tax=Methanosarcina flavescens TaxID=1715806 RepID=UPI00143546C5|nr:hypothetical protein [Methanosarcina flavescens]
MKVLTPNPIWREKHKLFKRKFDHKPFQKKLERKPFEKRFYRKRHDGVVKRRNGW